MWLPAAQVVPCLACPRRPQDLPAYPLHPFSSWVPFRAPLLYVAVHVRDHPVWRPIERLVPVHRLYLFVPIPILR